MKLDLIFEVFANPLTEAAKYKEAVNNLKNYMNVKLIDANNFEVQVKNLTKQKTL